MREEEFPILNRQAAEVLPMLKNPTKKLSIVTSLDAFSSLAE